MRTNLCRVSWIGGATFGILASVGAMRAQAEGFAVQPVLVESSDGWASLTVTNPSQASIYIENTIYDWRKGPDGKDHLVEATDAEISPPGIWVPGGQAYTIRVKMPVATGHADLAFRVMIKNVPSAADVRGSGLIFELDQSIPVFSIPPNPTPAVLSGMVTADGQLALTNQGGEYLRIAKITQNGQTLASGLVGYALPNTRSVFQLRIPAQPGLVTLETNQGTKTVELTK